MFYFRVGTAVTVLLLELACASLLSPLLRTDFRYHRLSRESQALYVSSDLTFLALANLDRGHRSSARLASLCNWLLVDGHVLPPRRSVSRQRDWLAGPVLSPEVHVRATQAAQAPAVLVLTAHIYATQQLPQACMAI